MTSEPGEIKRFTEANRLAWNEVAPYHQRSDKRNWEQMFSQPGYSCLDSVISGHILRLGIETKDVAQIGCNNGRELLSIKNMGAGRCVGFDISDASVAWAQRLAHSSRNECEFVRSDVYEIPDSYNSSFDVVLVTIGVLSWMPDLPGFFASAARLLRDGGTLLVYEQHPFMNVLDDYHPESGRLCNSYFRTDIFVEEGGLDYYGREQYDGCENFNFFHTVAQIIQACIDSGLCLTRFEEYPHDLSNLVPSLSTRDASLPLSYFLIAEK